MKKDTTQKQEVKNPAITSVAPDHLPQEPQATQLPQPVSQEEIQVLMAALRQIRRPLDSIPSYTPQNFLQQIAFYESGGVTRMYLYVGGTWKYTTLS